MRFVRRFRLRIFVALALAALAVGAAMAFTLSHDKSSDQCSRPVSQRTGGWACYEPPGSRATP